MLLETLSDDNQVNFEEFIKLADPDEAKNVKLHINEEDQVIHDVINSIWTKYDTHNSGILDMDESKLFIKKMLGKEYNEESFKKVFASIDKANDNTLHKNEVIKYFQKIRGAPKSRSAVKRKLEVVVEETPRAEETPKRKTVKFDEIDFNVLI